MYKKSLLLLTFLTISLVGTSHSPTEIGFRVLEEQSNIYLEVHLTTTTLFDILYALDPALEEKESLNLSHYIEVYEAYFNQSLGIHINEREKQLKYIDSNLIVHDATIRFLIQNLKEPLHTYSINIDGFDFYQNPNYTVLIGTETMQNACFLTKSENVCRGWNENTLAAEPSTFRRFLPITLLVGVLLALFWIYRKRMGRLMQMT